MKQKEIKNRVSKKTKARELNKQNKKKILKIEIVKNKKLNYKANT